ncbi:hypothetical protein DAEQUDRAFT_765150 [Daedalea quercina L-15889]|uniref:C3H1-type domain-containing protein n=1 Tax=Daedalea quercina L-15889 TaxID=1314783 RepID=A0A165QRE0_9APHY|nr:hypothetical protein DAEQUDRAFT_765150 [Daedalea quercina L-15889]
MTIPDPPWKQKTRPCPFYSQGRCLFADSCNFLHDVKAPRSQTESCTPSRSPLPSPPESPVDGLVYQKKARRTSKVVRFCSPPRSPRLSSLLMALGDAIQQDELEEAEMGLIIDDEDEDSDDADAVSSSEAVEDESPEDISGPAAIVSTTVSDAPYLSAHDDHATGSDPAITLAVRSSEDECPEDIPESIARASRTILDAPYDSAYDYGESHSGPAGSSSEDESPADMSDSIARVSLDAVPPSLPVAVAKASTTAFDGIHPSAYDDHETSSDPAITPRSSVVQGSDSSVGDEEEITITQFSLPAPRSPSTRTSSDLLSPIDLSGTASLLGSVSRECSASDLLREDSIDSGFAEGCFAPRTFLTSPPRSPRRISTLSILSSPFGSPTKRMRLAGEEHYHGHGVAEFFSPAFSAGASQFDDAEESGAQYSDVDSRPPSAEGENAQESPSAEGSDVSVDPLATVKVHTISTTDSPEQARRPSVVIEGVSPIGDDTLQIYNGYILGHGQDCGSDESHMWSDESSVPSSSVPTPAPEVEVGGRVFSAPLRIWTLSAESDTASPLRSPFEEHPPRVFSNPAKGKAPVRPASPWSEVSPELSPLPSPEPSPFASSQVSPEPPPQPSSLLSSEPSPQPPFLSDPEAHERQVKWERRASTKVPLAWRQSSIPGGSLSRGSSPRQGAARPRPPALTGLGPTSHDRDSRAPSPSPLRASVSAEGTPATEVQQEISPVQSAQSVPGSSRLKPLRLSMILSASTSASASPMSPSFQLTSGLESSTGIPPLTTGTTASSPVSSEYSLSNARLLSSRRSSLIPSGTRNTLLIDRTHTRSHGFSSGSKLHSQLATSPTAPNSAPVPHTSSWHARKGSRTLVLLHRQSFIEKFARPDSRASEPILYEEDEDELSRDETLKILRPTSSVSHATPANPSPPSPIHAIATPRPTLLFALASDNVDEVKRVLASGEAGPNDDVGPQSALAFTLTSRQLKHRQEMVKLLLAHGADPAAAKQAIVLSRPASTGPHEDGDGPPPNPLEELDHATKYYIKRADAPQTRRASALIHRSFFRPLARVRYDLVGQDRALEQLFRVLSMPTMAPVVVLLCGPSGHGKSLLARKFGSLLEVPTHTVNMTTLRDTHDIWRSYSMSPYEAPSDCTLADFLIANEGRRCVVVLDEIEKTPNEKVLSSLLMPWELGRCSFEAGHRHVDVSQVIWLGTSNIGHDLVFEHQENRQDPEAPMSREDYVDLMGLLRPRVSQRLGASLLSRVTTVLPFIPFTTEEKLAIAAEALHSSTSEETELPPATIDMIVRNSLSAYIPAEGARSLYRAVSNLLLDTI